MFKNMRLASKIYCGFGVIVMFLVVTSAVSWTRLNSIGQAIEIIVQDRFPKTTVANDIMEEINEVARAMRNILLLEKKEDMDKEAARIEGSRKAITEGIEKLQKIVTSTRGKELIKDILDARTAYTIPQRETVRLALDGKKKRPQNCFSKRSGRPNKHISSLWMN